jgi:hypothetical protein
MNETRQVEIIQKMKKIDKDINPQTLAIYRECGKQFDDTTSFYCLRCPRDLCDICFDIEDECVQKIVVLFKHYKELPDKVKVIIEINNKDIIITEGIFY